MTEEIKEILNFLKEPFNKEKTHKAIDKKDTTVLLNYITNLQKENTDLKKLCDKYEEEHKTTFGTWKTVIARNEKASDFILSKAKEYKPHFAKVELNTADCNELLNILEGGDE